METFTDEQISGKVIDHLGLVAATVEKLGLVEKIDARLPVSKAHGSKVSMGQRVSSMILNGLGFINNRLYMFPDFMQNKPVERLLGEGLMADDFNDDALGRCLDDIHAYGTTKLFSELAFAIGIENNLLGKSAHFDTSSLSVHGDYANAEESTSGDRVAAEIQTTDDMAAELENAGPPKTPTITHGYSKDHRPDLKQVVINLATTGAAGFPIWFESHSGNASDQKVLREAADRMQALTKELKDAPSFLYVADSAMYESCLKEGGELLWLSRVPERIKVAKELLQQNDNDFCWRECGKGYRICVIDNHYKGITQRWCLVSSKQAYERETKTLERNILKDAEQTKKAFWHLTCKTFGCEKDALTALSAFKKTLKYHQASASLIAIKTHKSTGRPKKDDVPNIAHYKIEGEIVRNEEKIECVRRQKGRFILATNEMDRTELPDEKLLSEYKEQSKTESGFRFIKNDTFEVSSIFLKKPSRIAALMMVMTLCLMVYSTAQYHLRESLKAAEDTLPDQLKKPTQKPTLTYVFKLFHGVQVLTIIIGDKVQELVINMTALLKKIATYFGKRAMSIYSLSG